MKKIFKNIVTIAAASLALSSCNLDLFPEATRVYDPLVPYFESADDVEQSEIAIYAFFRGTCGGSMYYLPDLMLNGFNAGVDFGNRLGDIHRADNTFTASSQDIEAYWRVMYQAIAQYNVIISGADEESVLKSDFVDYAQFVKAEALVARAYSYLQLARLFGAVYDESTASTDLCVPLVLVYDQNARPVRASVEAVYTQIANDLNDARVIFGKEESEDWLNENEPSAMYFTTDAISALEARVLLDTRKYAEAADKAAELINSKTYALSADAAALTAFYQTDNGTEAIMQCFASLDETPNGYGIFTGYAQDSQSPNGYAYSPDFIPSKSLISAYENPNDLRRLCWYELAGTGSNTAPIKMQGSFHTNINLFSKYKGNASYSSNNLPQGRVAAKPFLISEMYLIAAEGYFNAGNNSQATRYLNQLQSARKANTTAANESNINKEWFRETIGEGQYFFYLKRHGEGFSERPAQDRANAERIVVDLNDNDSYQHKVLEGGNRVFCWPIPTYERQCNSNLVQNPGYGN